MKSVTFHKAPATLAELNVRLEACLKEKSRKPLGFDIEDDQLPNIDFSLVGPVLTTCVESFADVSHDGLSLLQRRLLPLFPCTQQAQAAYRVFSASVKKVLPAPPLSSSIPIEEALAHFAKSASVKPQERLQSVMALEPKPNNPQEKAEIFQASLSWMLCEGRVLRLAALACQAATQIAELRPKADAPVVYPEEVRDAEELAFWLQLPGLLAQIRGTQTEPSELMSIYQRLKRHRRYRDGAMAVLEFQLALSQLYSREKTMATFVEAILPGSLLSTTLGRWREVQQVVAPFGTCFLKLRRSQKEKTKPGQLVLDHYFDYQKIFDEFMKTRDCQRILFEYMLEAFTAFIRERKKPREWMCYKKDAGPQGEDEELAFGTEYRTFDAERLPSPIEYLYAAQKESKAAPVSLKGKKFPFQYGLESEKGISRCADQFFDCGLKFDWEECILYVAPAQLGKQPGTLAYAVKGNICFHRIFHPRTLAFLFEKFPAKSFTLADFPELGDLVKALPELVPSPVEPEELIVCPPHRDFIKISPSLTLFPLYVDN